MKLVISTVSRVIGASIMAAWVTLPVWADVPPPPPPNAAIAGACKQDIQTLCPGVKPGDGRIAACFKTNHRLLSSGCKEAIREHRREKTQPAPVPGAQVPAPPPAGSPPPPDAPPSH
jgi:hypothetical protein